MDPATEPDVDLAASPWATIKDPTLPENRPDPYPIYHQMRALDPMYRSPVSGLWLITSYEYANAVLRDPRVSNNAKWLGDQATAISSPARQVGSTLLMFVDPPDHTRLRGLVTQAFTPRVVENMRPRIQAIVDGLIDDVVERGSMDVIGDLAYPLPVVVICEMLGIPIDDRESFKGWSSDASLLLDGNLSPSSKERAMLAGFHLVQYFTDLIEERRRAPGADLLSALIAAEEAGEQLSHEELVSTAILLFVAGHETTVGLITNAMLALLRNPDELVRLRDDPSLARTALEEFLRYDGPVHVTARIATEDMEVGGRKVAKGDQMIVLLGAADRDPAQFPDPDRLDVGRTPNRHLAFAAGPHYCLGAALARIEGQTAISTMLQRLAGLELVTTEPVYRQHFVLRGVMALEVAFSPESTRQLSR